MDIIIDIVIEILLGAVIDGAEDKCISKKSRVVCTILSTIVYGAFIVLFGMLFFENKDIRFRVLSAAVICICVCFLVRIWYKIVKNA